MRLFAALSLSDDLRDRLAALQDGLPEGKQVEWENFHLTLCFFGEVDGAAAEDLHAGLSAVDAPSFDLTLDGAGAFGGDRPRALYIAARPDPGLLHVQEKVEQAGRTAGVSIEAKKFTPHVTLMRFRPGRASAPAAAKWLSHRSAFLAQPETISSFQLYRSSLGRSGPIYEELARYALAAPIT
ncbi:MAG: RNA 2',3'-cyclic phosphodiesterase [Pseudomonadota bacterium]